MSTHTISLTNISPRALRRRLARVTLTGSGRANRRVQPADVASVLRKRLPTTRQAAVLAFVAAASAV